MAFGWVALWVACTATVRADQLAEIKHKGELVCGVLATDEPMSFVDPRTRTIVGYEVDLCQVVARKIGVTAILATNLFERDGDRWRLVLHHASHILAAPPAG